MASNPPFAECIRPSCVSSASPNSLAHPSRHLSPRRPRSPHSPTSASQGDYRHDDEDEDDEVCGDSPQSVSSDASLRHTHVSRRVDRPTHPAASPITRTTEGMARVSLEQRGVCSVSSPSYRGREQVVKSSSPAPKRCASSEPPGRPGRQDHDMSATISSQQSRANNYDPAKTQKRAPHDRPSYDRLGQHRAASIEGPQRRMMDHRTQIRPFVQSHDRPRKDPAKRRSSGVEAAYFKENTGQIPLDATCDPSPAPTPIQEHYQRDAVQHHKGVIQLPAHGRYAGLILQPDSSPISQEQLAAEVKGIYAGLVMVEAKCINIDAAQAADPKQQLGSEQWQALIALHRTLLYEHHDFLMATQHPSATPALRGLATKYSMPARMWKHGIHAFLEVLRHRRPESQDYMLAFIYLAYQMMALLFETVPTFTDTWIECLGDLARYRMAIEEEKEAHATWGGVAGRWYTLASDRHPAIGRLYHHLGILERPSLRKFCLYAKSLTCVIPFANARDSLATLCAPIVHDELTGQSSTHSVEVRAVTFHALISSRCECHVIQKVHADTLDLLRHRKAKIRDFGAYLAITNIAALFELGSPTNLMFQQYITAINQAMQQSRPSMPVPAHPVQFSPVMPYTTPSPLLKSSEDFWADCFNVLLQSYDPTSIHDFLPFVHVTLVGIHSLHSLRARLLNGQSFDTFQSPVDLGRLSWVRLADFLNTLAQRERITSRVLECARQGVFLAPERKEDARPLSEDYLIRGLIWGQFYFSPGWFDGQSEDDGRAIETPSMQTARSQRVLWLGLYLAFHTEHIQYDVQKKVFSSWSAFVGTRQTSPPTAAEIAELADNYNEQASMVPNPESHSSSEAFSNPGSEDSYLFVKPPKIPSGGGGSGAGDSPQPKQQPPPTSPSWAKVAAKKPPKMTSLPRKRKPDINSFKVADEEGLVWSVDGAGEAYDLSSVPPNEIRLR